MKRPIAIEEVERRLKIVHGDIVSIVRTSYFGTARKATFIDKDYGEYEAWVSNVLKGCQHQLRANEKIKKTNVARYGSKFPLGGKEIRKKIAATNLIRYGCENVLGSTIHREKAKQTMIENYGVDNPQKSAEIRNRTTKSRHNTTTYKHWKTGEEIVCTASYECSVARWLNENKIDYEWQVPIKIPLDAPENIRGRTDFIDLHILDGIHKDKYVEIKGSWLRETQTLKWNWFHDAYTNSELWNLQMLKKLKI
jgi:hypothetical protein